MIESFQFISIFIEGIISFFSPCIIPIIPLYMSYLSGNTKTINKDGSITYQRKTTFFHTLFFILGISTSFFILGLSVRTIGLFFQSYRFLLLIICGLLIMILGFFQIGIIKINFLQKEKKINTNLNFKKMNPLLAFVLGFLFSFAWTPCVGPALSSVLMLAGSNENALIGNLLLFVYALGFLIPFIILGLFTNEALNLLKKHQKLLVKLIKIGGILLIILGFILLVKGINLIPTKNLNSCNINESGLSNCGNDKVNVNLIDAPSFNLKDLNGVNYKLEDYQGKIIFLNFWSLNCNICKNELNDIEKLYQEYLNSNVIILTIISPKISKASQNEIAEFIKENNFSFPVLIDENSKTFEDYYITSYPNTFIIKDKVIKQKIPGALNYEQLKTYIENQNN